MSSRWKVVRREVPFPTPQHRREVFEDVGTAEEFHGPFTTHAEAMAYADHGARTVEVTLPRDPLVWESGKDSDGRLYVEETNGNEICYEPGQLGEIALRLLAYHTQKEESNE